MPFTLFKLMAAIMGSLVINVSFWAVIIYQSATTWQIGESEPELQSIDSLMSALMLTQEVGGPSRIEPTEKLKMATVAAAKKPKTIENKEINAMFNFLNSQLLKLYG